MFSNVLNLVLIQSLHSPAHSAHVGRIRTTVKTNRPFTLLLTPLLSNRTLCRVTLGFSMVHLAIVSLGLPSWPCPLRHGLGLPCPGCGLTRAIKALSVGDWQQAMAIHAFAPLAVVVLILMGYVSIAPAKHWQWIIKYCRLAEQKTHLSAAIITLFVAYWLIRLVFFREAFYYWVL